MGAYFVPTLTWSSGAGADPVGPVPDPGPRRPAADRHPGGTALKAPSKPVEKIGSLLPPAGKWKAFFKSQAKNPRYLRQGDVVTATIATPDGRIDLGEQRTPVADSN
jgi:hypothetical protein